MDAYQDGLLSTGRDKNCVAFLFSLVTPFQKLFTCEITGHSNLTFKEALRSEVGPILFCVGRLSSE